MGLERPAVSGRYQRILSLTGRQIDQQMNEPAVDQLNLEVTVEGAFPVVSLRPDGHVSGYVLLSYITAPFLLEPGELLPNTHSNFWEALQIAETFLNLGYAVDVIDWDNREFKPERPYSYCIDIHNLERLTPLLNENCVRILHITGAHWLFQNQAEYSRLLALQQRRGFTLIPRRIAPPSLGIEHADFATTCGNEFTISTFSYARKEIHRVPLPATSLYPWPEDKDYEQQRNHFLWFGNVGMVHKGLDLVLEAFAQIPGFHLTVCGLVDKEKDFELAYDWELYHTPNIETVGWIDTDSAQFQEITKKCVGVIHPSCSEGGGGSVVTCLHAGLIPIVSYESSVDVDDFGFLLKNSSVEDIVQSVKVVSGLSADELKEKSRKAWEYARSFYTRENYVACYLDFITNVLGVR